MQAILIGAGNIGSHAAKFVARIPQLTRLAIVDPDIYEAHNLAGQSILASDIGRPKAEAQARYLRRQNPGLEVQSVMARVEELPLGSLRSDILIAAVDTRLTRQYINEAAWALGIPWIDSGVHADGGLVRLSGFKPGTELPCLQCGWDERQYALLETRFACGAGSGAPRTNAPASLGGLAGALVAIEAGKLLAGRHEESLAGRELVIDSRFHKQHVIKLQRNPNCRFSHATPSIEPGPSVAAPVGQLLDGGAALSLPFGAQIVTQLACTRCRNRTYPWRLNRVLRPVDRQCTLCRSEMAVTGFGVTHRIDSAAPKRVLKGSFARLGLRTGDVVVTTTNSGAERYWELGES